jgi:putative transposase
MRGKLPFSGFILMVLFSKSMSIHEVYPTRDSLTSESFINGLLEYCDGRPEFIVDNAPWLKDAPIQLGLTHHHQARGPRSLIE